MPNRTIVSDLNPLDMIPANFAQGEQYNSRHIRDWPFPFTIHYWEQPVEWWQPWQQNDRLRLQFVSEVAPITVSLISKNGFIAWSGPMTQKQRNELQPTYYIYELDQPLTDIPVGVYTVVAEIGSPVSQRLQSSTLIAVEEKWPDTLLVRYKHHRVWGMTYFETGFHPEMRTWGTLKYSKPSSRNVVYENQELDMTLLSAKPFSLWRLFVGGPEGVPDTWAVKWNTLLCCSDVQIDGRYYTKADNGSQLEEKEEEDYPMRGWSIELRDRANRSARSFFDDGTTDDGNGTNNPNNPPTDPNNPGGGGGPVVGGSTLTVVINVDGRGFISDSDTNFYEIIDID